MEDAEKIVLTAQDTALSITTFGKSHTHPGHYYGPGMRPYYLIHFILSGKGTFKTFYDETKVYNLQAGQGFLIEPGLVIRYESDLAEPWSYIWVAFMGSDAENIVSSLGLSHDNPIFSCTESQGQQLEKCVSTMLKYHDAQLVNNFRRLSLLHEFFAVMAEVQTDSLPQTRTDDYVTNALEYIRKHLAEPFTVQELADYLRLNRSYMTTLFKDKTGMSPHEYIQQCRINKSRHLLDSSKLSIETIAYSCGYSKCDSYTRAFQRQKGMSPSAYRKMRRQESQEEV